MATDFVQHSAKIKQAAYLVVGTTKTHVSQRQPISTNLPELLQVINSSSQTPARLFFSRNRAGLCRGSRTVVRYCNGLCREHLEIGKMFKRDWRDLVRHTQRNATVAFRYCRVEIKKGTIRRA